MGYRQNLARHARGLRQKIFVPPVMRAATGAGPDFLCIGLQKSGTGWLYHQLRPHPDFRMPPVKELHYFDRPPEMRRTLRRLPSIRERVAERGNPDIVFLEAADWISWREVDLEEYARLFNFKGDRLSGDITPAYCTLDEPTIAAITARFPQLRVVLLVRDPVERFWSQLSMAVRKKELATADVDDWRRVQAFADLPEVQGRSYPSRIFSKWRRHVPEDRFGLYLFDDLESHPAELRARILQFLGADPEKTSGRRLPSFNDKASDRKQIMSEFMRARLAEYFAGELRACAATFGGPAASWPGKYGVG